MVYWTVFFGLGVNFYELFPLKTALKEAKSDSFGQKKALFYTLFGDIC